MNKVTGLTTTLLMLLATDTMAQQHPHEAPEPYIAKVTQGCAPIATAQFRGCTVTHVYHCPQGYQLQINWRDNRPGDITLAGMDGQRGSWVAFDGFGNSQATTIEDDFSIQTLLETGQERSVTEMRVNVDYYSGLASDIVEARLDGKQVTVDGQVFLTGDASQTTVMPEPFGTWVNSYDIFVSQSDALALLSIKQMTGQGVNEQFLSGLMNIYRPGEPGFLGNEALYDCN